MRDIIFKIILNIRQPVTRKKCITHNIYDFTVGTSHKPSIPSYTFLPPRLKKDIRCSLTNIFKQQASHFSK